MKRFIVCFTLHFLLSFISGTVFTPLHAQKPGRIRSGSRDSVQTTQPAAVAPSDSALSPKTMPEDSSAQKKQQAILDSLRKKSDIKAPIQYEAKDSIEMDMDAKILIMHNGANITYEEISLKADSIGINYAENLLRAQGNTDSAGKVTGKPVFTDDGQEYTAESMVYDIKEGKGLVKGARTHDGDQYIGTNLMKKDGDNVYYIDKGYFTTCDAEHPHYRFITRKLKVVQGKSIISGPLNLMIGDLPLPIALPFGFFPNQQGKRSGIIFPTYGESAERGFFLRNGGYYFALSDYYDLQLTGDIFSKGGFRLDVNTNYRKRYRFDGAFGFEYGVQRYGEPQDDDFRKDKNFFVRWKHDQKFSPSASLIASVNAGSSNYLTRNSYNEQDYLTNTLKSNISFRKTFTGTPFSLTANLDHNQNTQTKNVELSLPNIQFAKARTFPLRKKRGVTGKAFYEKIGYDYSLQLRNSISVPDSLFTSVMFNPGGSVTYFPNTTDTVPVTKNNSTFYKNGMQQSIRVTSNYNILQYITFSPNFSYNEYWYIKSVEKNWDPDTRKILTEEVNGFKTARDFAAGVQTNTRIYGLFTFPKNESELAIRHTLTPSVGYNYRPDFSSDFWKYYKTVQKDTLGNTQRYSPFSENIYTGPSAGEQQRITFGINNLVEVKFKSRKKMEADSLAKAKADSVAATGEAPGGGRGGRGGAATATDAFTRFNVFDQLSLNSSYNFAADSLKLADFDIVGRTNFFQNKFQFQARATLDPYRRDSLGDNIDRFSWQDGRFPILSSFNLTFGTGIRSQKRTGERKRPGMMTDQEWQDIQYYRSAYVDFTVPWSLNLNANLSYSHTGLRSERDTTFTVNFNGDFNLTPKWKIGYTSGYDFTRKDFSYTSFSIYRDLHCWEMSMTWIPFGDRQSYMITINVKSPVLKDLKLTKRNDWQDRF